MSRCFPFPPPGYEKKLKAENLDLLTKEKHKEKKHKKERREKEKKERKEKREKDRSRDKHKEKKDRKEKHKEKKKCKDLEKGRRSEDSIVQNQSEGHNELHIRESLQKGEGNDSKFAEELGRRTRDDGAANRMVGSITSSGHRKFEGMGVTCASSLEKERVADKKIYPVYIGSAQRNDANSNINTANIFQRSRNINNATFMEKERNIFHEKATACISSVQNRNQGIPRPIENTCGFVNRKYEYSTATANARNALERGKLGVASSSASTQRRNEVLGMSVENLFSISCKTEEAMGNSSSSYIHTRMEGACAVPETDRERVKKGSEMFPHPVCSEQRRISTSIGQPVEKDKYHKFGRKDKNEDIKKDEDRKRRVKEKDESEKKSRPKDAAPDNKYTKEEEEKIMVVKADEIENNKVRNFGKKDQVVVDTLHSNKPLAPHKDNTAEAAGIRVSLVDETSMKKRTEHHLKTNGFLQENYARPNKMQRLMGPSSQPQPQPQPLVVNNDDKTMLELKLPAPFSLSLKEGKMNNLKPDRVLLLDNKIEKKINGTAKLKQLAAEVVVVRPPAAGDAGSVTTDQNGEVSNLKLPHPDSKYLHQIYTVPRMEAWSEIDDSDWLFNCYNSKPKKQKQGVGTEEEAPQPQVWAEALRIESADVFALPYVLPF